MDEINLQAYQKAVSEVQRQLKYYGDLIYNKDHQAYFFNLKQKYPNRFKGILFDENRQPPYSKNLEKILKDLRFSDRCLLSEKNISSEQIHKLFSL